MQNHINQRPNYLRILTIVSLSLLGSQMQNTAKAEEWTSGINRKNEILIA